MRRERIKELASDQRVLGVGVLLLALVAIVAYAWFAPKKVSPSRRSGEAVGVADAKKLAGKGQYNIYFVDGANVIGIKDHGKEWSQKLRAEHRIFVVRKKAGSMPPGDWRGYYKAFNRTMIEVAREKFGSDVFEP